MELEIKLLQLTREGQQATLSKLAEQLHVNVGAVFSQVARLQEMGLLSWSQETVELDSTQRMLLADRLIRSGRDQEKVARSLQWQEFEQFAEGAVKENGFRVIRHLVFKSSNLGRREIDLAAWDDSFLLAIDCKHWLAGLSRARLRNAATAQVERTIALAAMHEVLARYGVRHVERRTILPVIITLGEPRERIVEGVPVVSVTKLASFLSGVSPHDRRLRFVAVTAQQSTLL